MTIECKVVVVSPAPVGFTINILNNPSNATIKVDGETIDIG